MARHLNIFLKIFLLFAIHIATQGCDIIGNSPTDSEVIGITTSFSKKLNIKHSDNLVVKSPPLSLTLFAGADIKNAKIVTFSDNQTIFAIVNCKNKEVTNLANPGAMERVLNKLGPEYRKTSSPFLNKNKTGLFIDNNQAKSILLDLSNRIGLPNDVENPVFRLEENYGSWIAKWQRIHNGYLFDKDYISISINAVSGEFESYYKFYNAEPCPTEVTIDRNVAIKSAYKKFVDYFPSDKWEKNKDKFELVSADLRIVKPDEYWQRLLPFYNAKSRLAWVAVFDVKKGQETKTIGVLNKDKSIIYVDAASNKILSSEINIVP